MNRRSTALLMFLALLASTSPLVACSSGASDKTPPAATTGQASAGAGTQARADPSAVSAVSDVSTTETGAGLNEEVIEVEAEDADRPHNLLAGVPIEPTPATVSWREVTSDESEIEFVYFAGGVLARIGDAYYERDSSGALLRLAEFELPRGELVGHWPKDAWSVVAESEPGTADFAYQLHQLGEDHEWILREYRGKSGWVAGAQAIRKGWRGGVLVRDGTRLTRLGSLLPTTKIGPRMGKTILDVFETRAGEIYSASQRRTEIYVQRACVERGCVQENARRLPHGPDWSFSMQIPRQQHSASMVASVDVDGVVGVMLLHYERGGWKLENLTGAPRGLWPDQDGGLWMLTGSALWHRSAGGRWHEVAPPEGASSLSAAMLLDHSELWLAATIEGRGVVFGTAAAGPGGEGEDESEGEPEDEGEPDPPE